MPPTDNSSWLGIERAIDALTRATLKAQNNIKQINMGTLSTDTGGGSSMVGNYGTEVLFTVANPGGFARQNVRVPADWKPNTDIIIRFYIATNNASNASFNYYCGCNGIGSNVITPAWNVFSNATLAAAATTAGLLYERTITIDKSLVSAGALVAYAIRPVGLTSNMSFYGAVLEYTAS